VSILVAADAVRDAEFSAGPATDGHPHGCAGNLTMTNSGAPPGISTDDAELLRPPRRDDTMFMPGSFTQDPRWTVDAVLRLPEDGNRYELLDGELIVNPAPRRQHQEVAAELFIVLSTQLTGSDYRIAFSPADFPVDDRNLVQPDLFVVPVPGGHSAEWPPLRELPLVIEIVSPSTASRDRWQKRLLYQREGIAEYWIVDVEARIIERWRAADERPEILGDSLLWNPPGSGDRVVINLQAMFDRAIGAQPQ
jgi:Uma2 family endonuclease